jgi:hypothetical protein
MIIFLVGDIGSGKSLSAVKEIFERRNYFHANFKLHGITYNRMKWEQLIVQGEKKTDTRVNFEYWKEQTKKGSFDIYLDEFHNLMSSRRAVSKKNVLLSDWLSQIRKILGQSELFNLYLLTQKLRRIDVNSRDLAQCCILCQKQIIKNIKIPTLVRRKNKLVKEKIPLCLIYKYWFHNAEQLQAYELWGSTKPFKVTRFIGNDYYKYYDSYEIVDFGQGEYL